MPANRSNISWHLHNMISAPAGVATAKTIFKTEDGITESYGTTVPTAAGIGYAEGCKFIKVNGGAGTSLYVNEGTNESCNFVAVPGFDKATAVDDGGPSPLLWDDAPVLETILNPGKGMYVWEDFERSLTEAETGGTLSTSTSGTFTDDPSLAGGIMVLDNAANTANIQTNLAWINMQCKPGVGTHIYFEVRLKVAVDDGAVLIGLHDDSTTDPLTAAINVSTDHAVFFRDEGTTAALMGHQTCDGSNVDTADDTIADVDISAYENFGIHIFGNGATAGDYVKFYHKGVLVKNMTTITKVPDAVMCPTIAIDNVGDTTQMKATIDWMRLLVYNATSGTIRV